jgi:hypothetical protein
MGRDASHATATKSDSKPVITKRNGSETDGAWASAMAAFLTGTRHGLLTLAGAGLGAANVSDEASIGLFLAYAREPALFELGVEMHWTAISAGVEFSFLREAADRFKDAHQRLRRLKAACVNENVRSAHAHDVERLCGRGFDHVDPSQAFQR